MAKSAATVLEQALELGPDERVDVAAELLASVEPPPEGWSEAWRAEIERRVAAVRAGTTTPSPLDEVRARFRARSSGG